MASPQGISHAKIRMVMDILEMEGLIRHTVIQSKIYNTCNNLKACTQDGDFSEMIN